MKKTLIVDIVAILYMILFLYTGISKLMEFVVFQAQLAESPVLAPVASLLAIVLPATEILLVIMLLLPRWRLTGLYASLILMICFTIYILLLLNFSDKLPCSCGGILSILSWPQHLIFNTIFILLAIICLIFERGNQKINNDKTKWNTLSNT